LTVSYSMVKSLNDISDRFIEDKCCFIKDEKEFDVLYYLDSEASAIVAFQITLQKEIKKCQIWRSG